MKNLSEFEVKLNQVINAKNLHLYNIRLGVKCNVCGHNWGIRIDGLDEIDDENIKFICLGCSKNIPKVSEV